MENKASWVTHLEFIVIFITLLSIFFSLDSKIEQQCISANSRIDQTNARLDQLYTMFIDLVKEQKKI